MQKTLFDEEKTLILKDHNCFIQHVELLKNGDFITCSVDGKAIIYDGKDKKLKLIINENQSIINYIKQLKDGNIVVSGDTVLIIKLENDNTNYQIIQTIDFYEEQSATVELNNEKLVFSYPFSIYEKIDGKYIFVGGVSNIYSHSLLQIKENEIATLSIEQFLIIDFNTFSIKENFDFKGSYCFDSIKKVNEKLIGICGKKEIGICIYNIESYQIQLYIQLDPLAYITTFFVINNNELLIAEYYDNSNNKRSDISHYLFTNSEELILKNKKEKAHNHYIDAFIKLNDGTIVTSSWDLTSKVWTLNE